MKGKILKSATIIPDHLYVTRKADLQLHQVIRDMGRPGYILVARQMGKTNLLLHAKRKLEDEKTVIVYIDLSNQFPSDRACFRNIVDTILRTHREKFQTISSVLMNNRSKLHLPPHQEHEFELITLLQQFDGNLVVILDEIDALTNADYSDQFFAQIRSVYFARANFPEFNRLT